MNESTRDSPGRLRDALDATRDVLRDALSHVDAFERDVLVRDARRGLEVALDVFEGPDVEAAVGVLDDPDAPLATSYPNGDHARPPFTPRQVLLLAHLARDANGGEEARRRILAEVDALYGRREPVRCGRRTSEGRTCRAWRLAFVGDGCAHHATADDRVENSRIRRLYDDELVRRLLRNEDASFPPRDDDDEEDT